MKLEVRDIEAMDEDAVAALADRLGMLKAEKRHMPYSLADAARTLGISKETMRLWVHAGEVARVPNVGVIRIPAGEIERLLNGEEAAR